MAAVRSKACLQCLQNLTSKTSIFSSQARCFGTSAILERLKMDYRIKPVRPKKVWKPPVIRDDFVFLYDGKARRAFPYHNLDLAMKVLRLCAVKEENVGIFIRFNLKGKDVRIFHSWFVVDGEASPSTFPLGGF